MHDVSADIRKQTAQQETDQIAKAEAAGIEFITLSDAAMDVLQRKGNVAHVKMAGDINQLYSGDAYRPANYLKEVQEFMGYKP